MLLEPALANAGGVTLTDATASGLPVVATRTGGVPAIVDDGVTGVLVSPGCVVPDAVAALTVLARPEPWHAMSTAARDRGRDVLSWATWARAAEELCREALASHH